MNISEKIENIKQYFVSFNIVAQDDAAYLLLRLPSTWVLPNTNTLKETYAVEIVARDEGVYFLTEIANGTDKLFECAETVVRYNKNIEERKYLLKERIEELSNLFATEELDKLKTLQFTFSNGQDTTVANNGEKKGKNKDKSSRNATQTEVAKNPKETTVAGEQKIAPSEDKNNVNDSGDNGLMAFAKELTGE